MLSTACGQRLWTLWTPDRVVGLPGGGACGRRRHGGRSRRQTAPHVHRDARGRGVPAGEHAARRGRRPRTSAPACATTREVGGGVQAAIETFLESHRAAGRALVGELAWLGDTVAAVADSWLRLDGALLPSHGRAARRMTDQHADGDPAGRCRRVTRRRWPTSSATVAAAASASRRSTRGSSARPRRRRAGSVPTPPLRPRRSARSPHSSVRLGGAGAGDRSAGRARGAPPGDPSAGARPSGRSRTSSSPRPGGRWGGCENIHLQVMTGGAEVRAIVQEIEAGEASRRRRHTALLEELQDDAAATARVLADSCAVVGGRGRPGDASRVVAYLAAQLPGWGDLELARRGRAPAGRLTGGTPEEKSATRRTRSLSREHGIRERTARGPGRGGSRLSLQGSRLPHVRSG